MSSSGTNLLLSVPLKSTTEIDLIEPLKRLFSVCGISKNFDKELAELNSLRSQILPKNLSKSTSGLESLKRYHDQIEILEKKIPAEGLNFQFIWEDAFDKGTLLRGRLSTNLPFLVFERQCVLFNIAAIQSQLATEFCASNSDEDLKTVAKWFQQAAGIFSHMSSSISLLSNQNLTLDLHSETLDALSILMLAQAQEMFVAKAIKDKMKDGIIAKLSVQAEDMFSDAILKMTKENIKHQWDRNWLANVAGKKLAYEALTQYFQSKVCATTKRIGEQIARLNLCLELLQKAQDKLQGSNLYSFYVTEANRIVAEAKKDNDFIYHEPIPAYDSLPTVEKVASARLAKMSSPVAAESSSTGFNDLFENLQPLHVPLENLSVLSINQQSVPFSIKSADQGYCSEANKEAAVTSDNPNQASPLKIAIDASLNAMNYYMQQYLKKPE